MSHSKIQNNLRILTVADFFCTCNLTYTFKALGSICTVSMTIGNECTQPSVHSRPSVFVCKSLKLD